MTGFKVDFRTIERSRWPNQCLALPPRFEARSRPDLSSPVFEAGPQALREAFDAALAREPRLEVVAVSNDDLQLDLVQRSRWLGFRDRIWVGFVALDPAHAAPLVWSRSEVGLYDFGVNRARVREWLHRLALILASRRRGGAGDRRSPAG